MIDFLCELTIRFSSKRYLKWPMLLCESTDNTPKEDRRPKELAHAMRAGAKKRTKTLMVKMGKLLAVAAPINTPEFLVEVRYTKTPFHPFGFLHYVSTI